MPWLTLGGLLLCNAIWATNPVMGKILLREFSAIQVSWLRYALAFLASLFFLFLLPIFHKEKGSECAALRANAHWIFLAGLFTFFGSALTQYLGLSLSTASANSIIVAMEPLAAIVLARIFLREQLETRQFFAIALALLGFSLLSNLKPGNFVASLLVFNLGNLLLLLTMPMEAMYTILSRKVAGRLSPLVFFTAALFVGFCFLSATLFFSGQEWPSLSRLSGTHWFALLWMGPLGTTITYTFWTLTLVKAPVALVALTLFLQPILGALGGAIFLQERLDYWQSLGAVIILSALLLTMGRKKS